MTGITGKFGRVVTVISAVSVGHELRRWMINDTGDEVEMDGFDKTPNALSQYRKNIEIGLVGGTLDVVGRHNHDKKPYPYFYVGRAFSGSDYIFCGITSAVGFTVTGKITAVTPTQDLPTGADFGFKLFIEGISFA